LIASRINICILNMRLVDTRHRCTVRNPPPPATVKWASCPGMPVRGGCVLDLGLSRALFHSNCVAGPGTLYFKCKY